MSMDTNHSVLMRFEACADQTLTITWVADMKSVPPAVAGGFRSHFTGVTAGYQLYRGSETTTHPLPQVVLTSCHYENQHAFPGLLECNPGLELANAFSVLSRALLSA